MDQIWFRMYSETFDPIFSYFPNLHSNLDHLPGESYVGRSLLRTFIFNIPAPHNTWWWFASDTKRQSAFVPPSPFSAAAITYIFVLVFCRNNGCGHGIRNDGKTPLIPIFGQQNVVVVSFAPRSFRLELFRSYSNSNPNRELRLLRTYRKKKS